MKKKLLISMYSMNIGGAERSLIALLENFDYEKYDIDLFLYRHEGEFMDFIPKEVNLLPQIDEYATFERPLKDIIKEGHINLAIARTSAKIKWNIKSKLSKDKLYTYPYMQYIWGFSNPFLPKLKENYELAIGFLGPYDFIINKVNAKVKMGWIHTDYKIVNPDKKLDYKMWNKLDYIVNVSEECQSSFIHIFPNLKNKCIVIENLLSTEFVKKQSKENIKDEIPNDMSIKICSVGRFCEAKGFDMAVKACKSLINDGYDVKWYIVGYGTDEDKIKDLIKKCSLEDKFIILGKKVNPYPYIKKCDIYCQPSRYEGKCVTVREAQILEKPVVITNYTTANSQLQDGIDGYITDLSVKGIAKGIEKIITCKMLKEKLIKNCSERDYSNYTELNKLYDILEEL